MYDLVLVVIDFIWSQPPLIIIAIVLCSFLGIAVLIPWRSLFYYYQISEVISELEVPQDIRNEGRHTEQEIVTNDDLCIQLRDLFANFRTHNNDVSKLAEVLTHVGIALLRHSGDHEEGIEMLKEALVLRRRVFGGSASSISSSSSESKRTHQKQGDHLLIAQSMNNLGLALESNGSAKDGLQLQKLSLEMYERLYGNEDHEAVATALNNVGESIISNRNEENVKVEDGIELLRKALDMRRRLYNHKTNPFHPSLWRSLENLALALEHFGAVGDEKQREEVIELRMEAEKIHEKMIQNERKNDDGGAAAAEASEFVGERSSFTSKKSKKE